MITIVVCSVASLIPWPSYCPIFDCLQYASDQKLDGGKAWEQGYSVATTMLPQLAALEFCTKSKVCTPFTSYIHYYTLQVVLTVW